MSRSVAYVLRPYTESYLGLTKNTFASLWSSVRSTYFAKDAPSFSPTIAMVLGCSMRWRSAGARTADGSLISSFSIQGRGGSATAATRRMELMRGGAGMTRWCVSPGEEPATS